MEPKLTEKRNDELNWGAVHFQPSVWADVLVMICVAMHELPDCVKTSGAGENVSQVALGVAVAVTVGKTVGDGCGITVGTGVAVGCSVAVGSATARAVCVAARPDRLAGDDPPNGIPPLRNISVPPPQRLATMRAAIPRISNPR